MQPSEFAALDEVGQDAWAQQLLKLVAEEEKKEAKRLNEFTKGFNEQQQQMIINKDPRSLINQASR